MASKASDLRVAIVGGGMGGLATAIALDRYGIAADIYEQAPQFSRVGAGIHVASNAVKVLFGLGLRQETLQEKAFLPASTLHREYDTGEITGELSHGAQTVEAYGAPYTVWHRGDLQEALLALVPPSVTMHRGRTLVGVDQAGTTPTLRFSDGTSVEADVLVGADGIHSVVRSAFFEIDKTHFTGRLAYRTVIPRAAVDEPDLDACTKWWGPDRHLVQYFVSAGRELAFTTSVPEADWNVESWSAQGDPGLLREEFAAFHPQVHKILAAVQTVNRWSINTHEPLARWTEGGVALLGDSSHTVTPYMGQGAALAMEDGVVLARCLADVEGDKDGIPLALRRYEATRLPRTTKVQLLSEANTWGRYGEDPSWLYGYDAWNAPLAEVVE